MRCCSLSSLSPSQNPGCRCALQKSLDDGGIEPGARALAHLFQHMRPARSRMEHLHHLRQQRDPRHERNGRSAQAGRFAVAIPVLVEAADAVGHFRVEAELKGNVRAAFATRGNQFGGEFLAVLRQVENAVDPLVQRLADTDVRHHEASETHQAVGVDLLEIAFHLPVVGAVQFEQARGVAAAARVLQQQRVVEVRQRLAVHPHLPADVHAHPATAQAVASGQSFGQVQGIAQGADDGGKREFLPGRGGLRVERAHGETSPGGYSIYRQPAASLNRNRIVVFVFPADGIGVHPVDRR